MSISAALPDPPYRSQQLAGQQPRQRRGRESPFAGQTVPDQIGSLMRFEGQPVVEIEGRLSAITLEMDQAIPMGTEMTLRVTASVRSVRHEPLRGGGVRRVQILELGDITLLCQHPGEVATDPVEEPETAQGGFALPSQPPPLSAGRPVGLELVPGATGES